VATPPEVERLVLGVAISAATWGCRRIAAYLAGTWQLRLAPSTVQRMLRRVGLATRRARLTAPAPPGGAARGHGRHQAGGEPVEHPGKKRRPQIATALKKGFGTGLDPRVRRVPAPSSESAMACVNAFGARSTTAVQTRINASSVHIRCRSVRRTAPTTV